jgi:hypothetical protein
MGRMLKQLTLGGRHLRALFDSGSERSYIRRDMLPASAVCQKISPFKVGLGGTEHIVRHGCIVEPEISGLKFSFLSHPLNDIGVTKEGELDLIVGATAMEEWDIMLTTRGKDISLKGLRKREFTEF